MNVESPVAGSEVEVSFKLVSPADMALVIAEGG